MINVDTRATSSLMPFSLPADTMQFISSLLEVAGEPDPLTGTVALMTRAALLRAWGEFQEHHPLILAPIYTDIPFVPGPDLTVAGVAEQVRGMRMAIAVNALGLPAVAVPAGIQDGLPQVVQLIGPRYREDLCLDAAAALEERLGSITPIDPH
jgi:amidase